MAESRSPLVANGSPHPHHARFSDSWGGLLTGCGPLACGSSRRRWRRCCCVAGAGRAGRRRCCGRVGIVPVHRTASGLRSRGGGIRSRQRPSGTAFGCRCCPAARSRTSSQTIRSCRRMLSFSWPPAGTCTLSRTGCGPVPNRVILPVTRFTRPMPGDASLRREATMQPAQDPTGQQRVAHAQTQRRAEDSRTLGRGRHRSHPTDNRRRTGRAPGGRPSPALFALDVTVEPCGKNCVALMGQCAQSRCLGGTRSHQASRLPAAGGRHAQGLDVDPQAGRLQRSSHRRLGQQGPRSSLAAVRSADDDFAEVAFDEPPTGVVTTELVAKDAGQPNVREVVGAGDPDQEIVGPHGGRVVAVAAQQVL